MKNSNNNYNKKNNELNIIVKPIDSSLYSESKIKLVYLNLKYHKI